MRRQIKRLSGIPASALALVLACVLLAALPARACTIFVLTDSDHALFCNNEDWSDPQTRLWFIPAGKGYFGAAYVGFEDGFAQGGVNTEGLACDWVAGYHEKWMPDPHLPFTRGNPCQRMLETCATVNEAIAFFKTHRVTAFRAGKILVADRTGASVIIGAKNGRLQVEPDTHCRGFGYGQKPLDAELALAPRPTVKDGFRILRACRQQGPFATKYSNIYDLKSGDIFLRPFPDRDDEVELNLGVELKKGGHHYVMAEIQEELKQAPRPLPQNMKRFPVDEYEPIADKEPKVTAHVRSILENSLAGTPRSDDYDSDMWQTIVSRQAEIHVAAQKLGELVSLALVDRSGTEAARSYRYRLEFAKATMLLHVVFDSEHKVTASVTEAVEWKPLATVAEPRDTSAGVGVALDVAGDDLIVKGIVPGSPAAAQKDIHVGDRIVAVAQDDGIAIKVQTAKISQAIDLIRGDPGTTVVLTLSPTGGNDSGTRLVRLVRAALKEVPR